MHSSFQDVPAVAEIAEGTIRGIEWGGMNIETGTSTAQIDPAPLFKGLPDDRCQCPHWGYVVKGMLRYNFAGSEEVFNAGDVYYARPGHLCVIEAGTEYVEFSPADELAKTMEVVGANMAAMMAGQG